MRICGRHCLTSEVLLANVLLKHRRARRESILVEFFSTYSLSEWENKMAESSGSRMRGYHAHRLDYVNAISGDFPVRAWLPYSDKELIKNPYTCTQTATNRDKEKEGHSNIP